MAEACIDAAGAIRAIDRQSVHQICSGQVVLTLATAVKELVENSIDAGATNVDVRLKGCGAELVEVSDNGRGVEEENFEGLTLKHHTSKLRDFSDLIHVETFGFRGEALSSLCALSNLSVLTCHESAQVGTKLVFDHNGRLVQRTPHPRQQGTTVSLQQLFYTLPVRHKEFHRNIKKEYTKMIHVLYSYCIISTGVRICCSNQTGQGKRNQILSTTGSHSMRENIGAIFGPKQLQSLIPFQQMAPTDNVKEDYGLNDMELPKDLFTITGFLSRGDHGVGRSATDRQFFYINNRPCDPSKVTKLVNEVYHMFNRHQYPFVALNIAVASECVDVNVTPDKRQIFLQEEKLLLATLKTSLITMYEAGVRKIRVSQMIPVSNSFHSPVEPRSESEQCQAGPSDDGIVEPGEEADPVLQSPKPSLNLAGLKAAFSNMHNSAAGTNPLSSKAGSNSSAQKILLSFFKTSPKIPTNSPKPAKSSLTQTREALPRSPVRGSQLDAFRFGGTLGGDADPLKDRVPSEFRTSAPQSLCCSRESGSFDQEAVTPGADMETSKELYNASQTLPEEPELQAEPSTSTGDLTSRPEAKRARREEPHGPTEHQSTLSSDSPQTSTVFKVDAPMCVQKRMVSLRFSVEELTGRMRRLQDQQRQKTKDELCYRRFRAKISPGDNHSAEEELKKEISKDMFREMEVIGQFNLGFIITRLKSDIFMIDQHATDEKYNFEMLQQHTVLRGQRLIMPQNLHLTAVSETVLMENIEIFRKNGFDFVVDESAQVMERVKLVSLPTSKNWTFGPADIEELIFMLSDSPGVMCRPSRVRQMFASRACRKSVMIGTALSHSEMKKLVVHMAEIEQPWNCPHGRPTMRHLANLDLISPD